MVAIESLDDLGDQERSQVERLIQHVVRTNPGIRTRDLVPLLIRESDLNQKVVVSTHGLPKLVNQMVVDRKLHLLTVTIGCSKTLELLFPANAVIQIT